MNPNQRRLSLLLNPSAGSGRSVAIVDDIKKGLDRLGATYTITMTESLEHAREQAVEACKKGEVVVAVGGDGILGALAGVVSKEDGVLGLIPAGRGNDFARVAGLSKDVGNSCRVLLEGREDRIDLGLANGHPFVGIASCGVDSAVNRYANETKLFKGKSAYAYSGIRSLIAWRIAQFTVTASGESTAFRGFTVACANSKAYGGGMYIAPEADLHDGLLDVITVGDIGKLGFIRNMPKVFKGAHIDGEQVKCMRAQEVTVDCEYPIEVYADGDCIGKTPVTVSILPKALRVLLP